MLQKQTNLSLDDVSPISDNLLRASIGFSLRRCGLNFGTDVETSRVE